MIEIKLLSGSEMEINGEISADVFSSFKSQAIKELSEELEIPGFRRGRVPEEILLSNIGEDALLKKMAILAIKREYPKIIKERKIKAIGRPNVIITKLAKNNPLGFKIHLYVLPEINLPDYRAIARSIEKEEDSEKRYIKILDKIIEQTEIEIPKILIEGEKIKMLEETKQSLSQIGLKWEDYLSQIKKSEEELLKEWEPNAVKRVKYGLLMEEIASRENIDVSEEEVEKEVEKIMREYKNLDERRVRLYTYGIIRNQKLLKIFDEQFKDD